MVSNYYQALHYYCFTLLLHAFFFMRNPEKELTKEIKHYTTTFFLYIYKIDFFLINCTNQIHTCECLVSATASFFTIST